MSEEELGFVRLELEHVKAERDELQARIDAYEGNVERWEEMHALIKASSLGTPGAESLADRTPEGVGRAIVLGAEYLRRAEVAEAERDRLRAVVDVADDFWALIESIYDQALGTWEYGDARMKYVTVQISKVDLPTLHAAYASPLDESGDMGGMTAEQAYDHYADPANQEPVGPPVQRKPVEQDRQRIWSAITAWEEVGYVLNADTGVPEPTDFRHKPLSPFFDELRAMVFDESGDTDG